MEKVKMDQLTGNARRICITGHIRPDGDCVGACLGLRRYLLDEDPEREVDVYLQMPPASFQSFSGFDQIREYYQGEKYDLCITLDASDLERLGDNRVLLDNSSHGICIDHHVTNTHFVEEAYVYPHAAATCEILVDMLEEDKISRETAECLYLGLIHDTGVFKHSNTTRHTMEAAGKLLEKGIHHTEIINDTFFAKTYRQNQLLGRALVESILFFDGKCIVSCISKKSMEFYHATHADLDGIVDQLRITKGVDCAIFLTELDFRVYKVSMRSSVQVDVAAVASYFGGGGHIRAAGCTMQGTFYDVVNNLSAQIALQLEGKKA
jgi:phosphoesterase RecJ-like protein